jgi:hypothetical protein
VNIKTIRLIRRRLNYYVNMVEWSGNHHKGCKKTSKIAEMTLYICKNHLKGSKPPQIRSSEKNYVLTIGLGFSSYLFTYFTFFPLLNNLSFQYYSATFSANDYISSHFVEINHWPLSTLPGLSLATFYRPFFNSLTLSCPFFISGGFLKQEPEF